MSAHAKKILADYRPNRFPSVLQILKTGCNASGEQSEIHQVITPLLPVKNQYVTEVQNQDKWQEPGTIVEVIT